MSVSGHNRVFPQRLAQIRKARSTFRASFGSWTFFIGLLLVAGAVTLLADGLIVWGAPSLVFAVAVSWLGGVWVIPFSEDSYLRGAGRIIHETRVDTGLTTRTYQDRLDALRQKIVHDAPALNSAIGEPPERYLSFVNSEDKADARLTYERAVWAIEFTKALNSMTRESETGAKDASLPSLRHEISRYLQTAHEGRDLSIRSFIERSEKLTQQSPPHNWQAQHDEYVARLSGYIVALRDYYASIESDDPDLETASAAAATMIEWQHALDELGQRFTARLSQRYSGSKESG